MKQNVESILKTENPSGIYSNTHRVLVKPDEQVTKVGSIELPVEVIDRLEAGSYTGTIVSIGPTAFMEEKRLYGVDIRRGIQTGMRVMFGRYAGLQCIGKDGKKYRLLNDEDITAFCDNEVRMEAFK